MTESRPDRKGNREPFAVPDEQSFAVNLLEQLVVPTFVLDAQARVIVWNRACERLTGVPASEVLGTSNHWQGFYDSPRPTLADLVLQGRNGEADALYQECGGLPDQPRHGLCAENWCDMPRRGTRRYLAIDAGPIHEGGRLVAVVETLRDVTLRKEAQQALRDADRRKDEFLAMLSHELRNPLAPISMSAQLLQLTHIDAGKLRETGAVIARQVEHMTRLVDDLLDVSRVTRGLVRLHSARVNIDEVLDDAIEQALPLVRSREHRLDVTRAAERLEVNGDKTRLVQILVNLLNNAARYSPPGGRIRLAVCADGAEVLIRVSDEGIGIAPELLPHVFDLFTQGERSVDRSQGGLGLGLALVKSLVELQGGEVSAHSAGRGKGAEFIVRLPRAECKMPVPREAEAKPRADESACRRLDLMVVDDNIDAARTLALYLEAAGHRVTVCHDGEAALKRMKEGLPQAIILDIGLPGMSGCELARRIKSTPDTAHIVLIAISGYGQLLDQERSRAAGFAWHFAKPVHPARLAALLAGIGENVR